MLHKLLYSKTAKYDAAAAALGVIFSAAFSYLTLSSLGSGGVDLSDLTCLAWYLFIWFTVLKLYLSTTGCENLVSVNLMGLLLSLTVELSFHLWIVCAFFSSLLVCWFLFFVFLCF